MHVRLEVDLPYKTTANKLVAAAEAASTGLVLLRPSAIDAVLTILT